MPDSGQSVNKNIHHPHDKGYKKLLSPMDRILDESNPWEVEVMIYNLEIALDEALQRAIAEGKLEGIKEGKLEGIKEGEIKGKLEVAKAALEKGFSIDVIVDITGLAKEVILKIKKDN